jgi:hypothetical protein
VEAPNINKESLANSRLSTGCLSRRFFECERRDSLHIVKFARPLIRSRVTLGNVRLFSAAKIGALLIV